MLVLGLASEPAPAGRTGELLLVAKVARLVVCSEEHGCSRLDHDRMGMGVPTRGLGRDQHFFCVLCRPFTAYFIFPDCIRLLKLCVPTLGCRSRMTNQWPDCTVQYDGRP